jgi:hypothetical protein
MGAPNHNPTGPEVLALYERVYKLVESGHSKGIYEEFRLFMVAAREYKFAHLKRKKGTVQADEDDDHDDDDCAEGAHLRAAINAYPQALAAVERGEAASRATARVPAARSAGGDEAGSAARAPAAGEPVFNVAEPDPHPPGEVRLVRIDEVIVPEKRMRQLGDIGPLIDTIREIGVIEPIILRRDTKELISGLHRLESVRALGQDEILARLVDVTDLQAEMMELDENLARVKLTPLERGEHIRRRKQLYEALHPEVKHGGAPGKSGGGKEKAKGARAASFAADTAKKTGLSQRTVQEDAQIGNLSLEAKRVVKGTPLANKKRELLALARLPKEEQVQVAKVVTSGKIMTVAEAAQKSSGKPRAKATSRPTHVEAKIVPRQPKRVAIVTRTVTLPAKPCWSCGAPSASPFAVKGTLETLPSGEVVEVSYETEKMRQIQVVGRVIASARAMTTALGKLPPEMDEERSRLLQEAADVITKGLHTLDAILSPVLKHARAGRAAA